jgi:hypothetical protein
MRTSSGSASTVSGRRTCVWGMESIETDIRRLAGGDGHPLEQRVGVVRQLQQKLRFRGECLANAEAILFGAGSIRRQASAPDISLSIDDFTDQADQRGAVFSRYASDGVHVMGLLGPDVLDVLDLADIDLSHRWLRQ